MGFCRDVSHTKSLACKFYLVTLLLNSRENSRANTRTSNCYYVRKAFNSLENSTTTQAERTCKYPNGFLRGRYLTVM